MKEETTREKILGAAKEIFSMKGYERATTKEISALAGVAEITLFRHFETKNNLFHSTISHYIINTMLDSRLLDGKINAKEAIINLAEERINTLRENKDLFICTVYEAQFNKEIKEMLHEIHSKVFEVLLLFLKFNNELFYNIKIEYAAQLLLSTLVGIILLETLGGNKEFANSENLIKVINSIIFN